MFSGFELLRTGAYSIKAKIDKQDYKAICKAISIRQRSSVPHAHHDDATNTGCLIAEVCRGWLDMIGEECPRMDDPASGE